MYVMYIPDIISYLLMIAVVKYSISMHDIYNETIPAGWLAVAKERDLPELSSLTSLSW